jgi:hypothetical protein
MVGQERFDELVATARRALAAGAAPPGVAAFLWSAGMSEIQLIQALRELTGTDLVGAKRLAHETFTSDQRTLADHQRELADELARAIEGEHMIIADAARRMMMAERLVRHTRRAPTDQGRRGEPRRQN